MTGFSEGLIERSGYRDAAPEVGTTFERLRETAQRILGEDVRPLVCYRIRTGVK